MKKEYEINGAIVVRDLLDEQDLQKIKQKLTFEIVPELLSGLKEYFEFYNFEKPHQSLVGKTLAELYWRRDVVKKAA